MFSTPLCACINSNIYSSLNYWKRFFFLMLHILSLLLIWITILFVLSSLLFDDDLLVNRSTTEEDDFFENKVLHLCVSSSKWNLRNVLKRFLLQATMAVIIQDLSCIKSNVWQHYQNTRLCTLCWLYLCKYCERGLVAGNKCIS